MENKITHRTERIPGIVRNEIYELDDLRYTEQFDDVTNQRLMGYVEMYGNIRVCLVGEDGILSTNLPTGWVVSRKEMLLLKEDVDRLDKFLLLICENYDNVKKRAD